MASRLGIKTEDIILSPLGGLARLKFLPFKPFHEFLIAIAGPLINLLLALVFSIILWITNNDFWPDFISFEIDDPIIIGQYIVWINAMLFIFNLIPALPLDGGRIVRSILSVKFGRLIATRWVSLMGKSIAFICICLGIFYQYLGLSLVGLFIMLMDDKDYQKLKVIDILSKAKVLPFISDNYAIFFKDDTISKAKYASDQGKEIIVISEDNTIEGFLRKQAINQALTEDKAHDTVLSIIHFNNWKATPHQSLLHVSDHMKSHALPFVPVVDDNNILGILHRHTIEEYIKSKLYSPD